MAAGADRTAVWTMMPAIDSDFANDAVAPSEINAAARTQMASRLERMQEIFRDIRGEKLPPWPYPTLAEAKPQLKDPLITGESDLTVIGETRIRKNRKHEHAREEKLRAKCNRPVPAKETGEQYAKRLSLPCPGMLE